MQEQNSYITPPPVSNAPVAPVQQPINIAQKNNPTKTIVLVVVSLVALIFIGLFIWMYIQWNEANTNLEAKISEAVAIAVDENTTKLETDFIEREKNPYKTFAGPVDYGELTFSYPKTWSVYEAADASDGRDYEAYLNPDKVSKVDDETINALRVSIVNSSLENVLASYQKGVERGETTVRDLQINGENALVYEGQITRQLVGRAAIFRIRDKTVIMQTDAKIFYDDFDKILSTVSFNK